MTMATDRIVKAALRLPRPLRALLAEKLLDTLDYEEEFDVSAKWMEEIRRRCREIQGGRVNFIPAEQVFEEIEREIG